MLIWVLRTWPAGSGIPTACFLLGYGGLRFFVDQFRDYESVLLGLGPGQWFNLAMAALGAVMLLVWGRKRTLVHSVTAPTKPSSEPVYERVMRIAALTALILFPLCIPNSWDTEHLQFKRQKLSTARDGTKSRELQCGDVNNVARHQTMDHSKRLAKTRLATHETAAQEAFEEVGVAGKIPRGHHAVQRAGVCAPCNAPTQKMAVKA